MARVRDFAIRYSGRIESGGITVIPGKATGDIKPCWVLVERAPDDAMLESLMVNGKIENIVDGIPVAVLREQFIRLSLLHLRKDDRMDVKVSSLKGGEIALHVVSDLLHENGRILHAPWSSFLDETIMLRHFLTLGDVEWPPAE